MPAQQRARLDPSLYAAALANSGVAIAFGDAHGRITEVNQAFLDLLGYDDPNELVGRLNSELAADTNTIGQIMAALQAGRNWKGEARAVKRDNTELLVHLCASAVCDANGQPVALMASFVDLSERERAAESEREHTRRIEALVTEREARIAELDLANRALNAIAGCSAAVLSSEHKDDFVRQFCALLVRDGGYSMAWIGVMDHDSDSSVRVLASAGDAAGYLAGLRVSYAADEYGRGPTGVAIRSGRPSVNRDSAKNPNYAQWRQKAEAFGYGSSIALPVVIAGRTAGVLNIYASQPHAFDDAEVMLLTRLCDVLAQGIEYHDSRRARAEARQALEDSELKFRQLAEHIRDVFWISTPDKRQMLYVSPAYERIWGRNLTRLYEQPWSWMEAVHPDDRSRVEQAALTDQVAGTYDIAYRVLTPAGDVQWIHDRAFPVVDAKGDIYRIVGVAEDITTQSVAEAALRTRALQQQAVARLGGQALSGDTIDSLLDAAVTCVIDTLGVDLAKILEWRPDSHDLLLKAGIGWRDGAIGAAIVGAGAESQAGFTLTSREPVVVDDLRSDPRFNGPPLLVDHGVVSGVSVIVGTHEHPYGVLGAHTRVNRSFTADDVHFLESVANTIAVAIERKQADTVLANRETQFRSLIENAADLVTVVSADAVIAYISPSITRVTGLTPTRIVGHDAMEFVHPDDAPRLRAALAEALSQPGTAVTVEYRFRDAADAWRVFESIGRSAPEVFDRAVIVNSRDITDRKQAESVLLEQQQQLARQARLLREMQIAAKIGGWELDIPTGDLYWTDQTYAIHEVTPGEFRLDVESAVQFYLPDSRIAIAAAVAAAKDSGAPYDLELQLRTAKGNVIWVRTVGQTHSDGGRPVRLFGAIQDITSLKRLEEQFRQAQKMDAIGQLSGGVAHDFNNLLTVIQGSASLAIDIQGLSSEVRSLLEDIAAAGERAAGLTRQLLLFSRRQVMQPREFELNETTSQIVKMLQRIVGEDVRLQVAFAPKPIYLFADPGMLDQVLLNLAVNSRDAMPDGGSLTIGLSTADLDKDVAATMPGAYPGEFACITVGDTGQGIEPEHLARIFEPFFTTKEVGKGTGLGLATVYGIIQQHKGWVTVESHPGTGTTFRLYVPRREKTTSQVARRVTRPAGGTETILVVEDEPALRDLIELILHRFGYRTLAAASGARALEVWESHAGDIALLLTDIVMPDGMRGTDLARTLVAGNPLLKVLYTSGYSPELAGRDQVLKEGLNFVSKPFTELSLATAVRAALDKT